VSIRKLKNTGGSMKITIEREDGESQVIEGREADNFMFQAMAGIAVFNMPIVMSLCGHPNFDAHVRHMMGDKTFAQMFVRAVRTDNAESWNDLLFTHYGGEEGFQALKQQTLDEIKADPDAAKHVGLATADGPACVELT